MNRFANITSITLLSLGLSMAGVGCLAASPDDEATAEIEQAQDGQGTAPQPPSASPSSGGWTWVPGGAYLPSSGGSSTPPVGGYQPPANGGYPAPANGGYASPPSAAFPPPAGAYTAPPFVAWPSTWNWTPPPPPSSPPPSYPTPCSGYGPFPISGGCG